MATNHVAVVMAQVETTSFPRSSHSFFPTTFFLVTMARCYFFCVVVDPCFIYRHKSTQKLFWIAVKIGQILLRSGHTNTFLVDCEQSRHPSCTELSHAQMCVHTLSWDGYDLSYITHPHFRVIQNNIMDFIDHFWCSDLVWTTWTWYGFCARTATTKLGKPLLNHSIRWSRVRIIFIELGLGFW